MNPRYNINVSGKITYCNSVSLNMTAAIILTICSLILIAYIFDLTATKTKVPSVILLLLLGWLVRQTTDTLHIHVPYLNPVLPVLGTIGLILIVLEGSLELEYNATKIPLIKKSFAVSILPILILAFLLAWLFHYFGGYDFKISFFNAIPFVIISSSIAIPSVNGQNRFTREFVIYESSFSDILGILLFNFFAFNKTITYLSFGYFAIDLIVMAAVSIIASILLALLLSKIDHHIKFAPIVILIVLIYEIAKIFNLPALLFILLFGTMLGNINQFHRFKWIEKFKPEVLNVEVHKFKELIVEGTFLVRTIFFILFGFLLDTHEIVNPDSLVWALVIIACILIIRLIVLKLFRLTLLPLLFIAPRGLINILLFLSIVPDKSIPLVSKSLIVQVIILSAFIMMLGLMLTKKNKTETQF